MGKYEKKNCPLCTSDAEYCNVDSGNRQYFSCPSCNYFQISWRAEELLAEKPDEYKAQLAAESKRVTENYLFTILMPTAKDREENPNVSIVAKILPKSELPLN